MIKLIRRLYKKWHEFGKEEVIINLGYYYIKTNNYTIQFFILIFLLVINLYTLYKLYNHNF
jgi:hypothetical protein